MVALAIFRGHPESTAFLCFAAAALFAVEAVARAREDGARLGAWRRAWPFVAAIGLGLGLGAVMLLPLVEFLAHAGEPSRSSPALPWRSAAAWFFPDYWGRPDRTFLDMEGGPANYLERAGYVGAAPVILAAAGLAVRRSRHHAFFAALAAVGLAVALPIPALDDVLRDLPGTGSLALHRGLVLTSLGVAVLAALWPSPPWPWPWRPLRSSTRRSRATSSDPRSCMRLSATTDRRSPRSCDSPPCCAGSCWPGWPPRWLRSPCAAGGSAPPPSPRWRS